MKILNSNEQIINLINKNKMVLIYFTGLDCGACEAIKHKIESLLTKYPNIKNGEISGEKHPDIAAKYNAFSLPLCILYIEKKEFIRTGRNIDLLKFEKDLHRYYKMVY